MFLTKFKAKNFSIFENIEIPFNKGLNIFIGENGVGKTHIMKLLYAACQSSKHDISFSEKAIKLFRPNQSNIGQLVNKNNNIAKVLIESNISKIEMIFSTKTKKHDNAIIIEEKWKEKMSNLTSIFIPTKEIISNIKNLDINTKNIEFDDTYLDIIMAAKKNTSKDIDFISKKKYFDILKKIDNVNIDIYNNKFYLNLGVQKKLEFNLAGEGLCKIGLLRQLIKNGTIKKDSILFWDEPETNMSPKYIPILAELLIMLENDGIQIFISTHSYFLAKYIEIKKNNKSNIQYISLYKDEENKIQYEIAKEFELLEHNIIIDIFRQLYKEEVKISLK